MTKNAETFRVFCAVELPDEVRRAVIRHAEKARVASPEASASWTREENIHLTIKFISSIPTASVEKLSNAAKRAVSGSSPFRIFLENTGAFPKLGTPRVLWIGVNDPSGGLAQLHERLDEECFIEGIEKDERPFHPHLTIARLRKPEGARKLADVHKSVPFPRLSVNVSELFVIRSELSSKGSRYTTLSRHLFKKFSGQQISG